MAGRHRLCGEGEEIESSILYWILIERLIFELYLRRIMFLYHYAISPVLDKNYQVEIYPHLNISFLQP